MPLSERKREHQKPLTFQSLEGVHFEQHPKKETPVIMKTLKLSDFKKRFENQQKHVHLIALVSPT